MHLVRPPLVWPSIITPQEELAAIADLGANLEGIAYGVDAWVASLELYELASDPPDMINRDSARRWRFIACAECVMQLHHLGSRLRAVRGAKLRGCGSLLAVVDVNCMRTALRDFGECFPHIDELRHAIAHLGANDANPQVHAPDGKYFLVGISGSHRFEAPYKGNTRYLDISRTTLGQIHAVVAQFFRAFEPAAALLLGQGHLP